MFYTCRKEKNMYKKIRLRAKRKDRSVITVFTDAQ